MAKVRVTATFVREYDLDPADYGAETLEAVIEEDKKFILEDPISFISARDTSIEVSTKILRR